MIGLVDLRVGVALPLAAGLSLWVRAEALAGLVSLAVAAPVAVVTGRRGRQIALATAAAFAVIVVLSTVDVVRTGTDPVYLEEFARTKAADLLAFQTYTVSETLGAATVMLALLPAWARPLGLIGSAAATRSS
jgi:hypothetical protein